MKRRIWLIYLFYAASSFQLEQGVFVLYLLSKGFSLWQIGLAEGVLHVTLVLSQVPTGAFADKYGRKISLALSQFLSILYVLFMLITSSLFLMILAFFTLGVAYAFRSGVDESVVFDTCREIGEESRYSKRYGQILALDAVTYATAVATGGFVAAISYPVLWVIRGIQTIAAGAIALFIHEPARGNNPTTAPTGLLIISRSLAVFRRSTIVRLITYIFAVVAWLELPIYFLAQQFYKEKGLEVGVVSTIIGLGAVTWGLGTFIAHRIEKLMEKSYFLMAGAPIISLSILGIALLPLIPSALLFLLLFLITGTYYILLSDMVNRLLPSEERATILSMRNLTFSALTALTYPFMGLIGDRLGVGKLFIGLAFIFLVTVGPSVMLLTSALKKEALKPHQS